MRLSVGTRLRKSDPETCGAPRATWSMAAKSWGTSLSSSLTSTPLAGEFKRTTTSPTPNRRSTLCKSRLPTMPNTRFEGAGAPGSDDAQVQEPRVGVNAMPRKMSQPSAKAALESSGK